MIINPAMTSTAPRVAATTAPAPQAASPGIQPQQITTTDFMTLLAAQLKGQDPSNPVDPTTFVTQLAQFVELSQVSNIDTLLQNYIQSATGNTGTPASSGTPSAPGTGSNPPAGSQ